MECGLEIELGVDLGGLVVQLVLSGRHVDGLNAR